MNFVVDIKLRECDCVGLFVGCYIFTLLSKGDGLCAVFIHGTLIGKNVIHSCGKAYESNTLNNIYTGPLEEVGQVELYTLKMRFVLKYDSCIKIGDFFLHPG